MSYPSIRIEGAIFSPDILGRLDNASGQDSVDFGYESTATVKNEIARAWADAQDYWRIFQRKMESLKADSAGTTETRNNWIVPLLGLLGYQLEYQSRGVQLNAKNYPISHRVINKGQTPIHITGYREKAGLDRKPEKAILRMSPHALVQEYLNLTDQIYGFVTNGRVLRLLRDSSRLIRLTFLEFDLDRIFTDGLFADFAVLFRLLHSSRLPQSVENSSTCWLERYHQEAIEQGTRIRDGLRLAVTEALETFGTGFLVHPNNHSLREQISSGKISSEAYFNYLLRLIYRLLFLMVTEERGLVFPKGTPLKNTQLYFEHYSLQRLRRLAMTRGLKIERFQDAWMSLMSTFNLFEKADKAAIFGTTALGGQLFHQESLGPLSISNLNNSAFFNALERLCYFNHPENDQRMAVNFGALATEEFGSVYESLLELHPVVETGPFPRFGFRKAAGNERKTSGSYYTPPSLVECLLDSALNPVLEYRVKNYSSMGFHSVKEAILSIKVCDPACGSGHFLIAASQRIARRLAMLVAKDEEPSPELIRHSLREVIGHCIHGVDINPMSVELCKVGLWLEAIEPGKPLTFLDHHIRCGNSLIGATPDDIIAGIPEKAYDPIVGDTKDSARWMRNLNEDAIAGQITLDFSNAPPWERLGNLPAAIVQMESLADDTPEALRAKENRYREIVEGSSYDYSRLLHDTWCAAFVWPKQTNDFGSELTTEHLRKIEGNPFSVSAHLKQSVRDLASQYRFFHWHLEFPAVFGADGKGGFDCFLGNPPWEKINLKEKEWFAERLPEIAEAINAAARKRLIERLKSENIVLYSKFQSALRQSDGESHFIKNSGAFPLCGRGDINLYSAFAECMRTKLNETGYIGCVLPSGIATDDTTKYFFQDIIDRKSLVSLFDFENRMNLFPAVDSRMKFCLFTCGGLKKSASEKATFVFFAQTADELNDPSRRFTLNSQDIALLNPNSRTCPIFRSQNEADLTKAIYNHTPILIKDKLSNSDNRWGIEIGRMFHTSDDSPLFRSEVSSETMRLYEAKCFWQYDHRFSSFDVDEYNDVTDGQKKDPLFQIQVRNNVEKTQIPQKYLQKMSAWYLSFRRITNATNARTLVASIVPESGLLDSGNNIYIRSASNAACLLASLNSFIVDYVARQKMGGSNMSVGIISQLPIPSPDKFEEKCKWSGSIQTLKDWLLPRILELTYTAWDLEPFAKDCDFAGTPFRWDEERRFQIQSEINAALFHIYQIERVDLINVMDTFPIIKRKDETQFGAYRTRDLILNQFDAMTQSRDTGSAFVSSLHPQPGDLACCHPPRQATSPVVAQQVEIGRAVFYINLLLHTWAKPIEREALEAGLVFMFNDSLRRGVLEKSNPPPTTSGRSQIIIGMDLVLANMKANGTIDTKVEIGRTIVWLGLQIVPISNAPTLDVTKAKDSIQAVQKLGESRVLSDYSGVLDVEYELV